MAPRPAGQPTPTEPISSTSTPISGDACISRRAARSADDRVRVPQHLRVSSLPFRALDLLGDVVDGLHCVEEPDERRQAFLARLVEFRGYLSANAAEIPNYGERRRCGEPVSSAIAESTVNQVISKRMVKKQQMRWSPRGAHLLLQLRTRVLNADLADDFTRWYPGFATPDQPAALAA